MAEPSPAHHPLPGLEWGTHAPIACTVPISDPMALLKKCLACKIIAVATKAATQPAAQLPQPWQSLL